MTARFFKIIQLSFTAFMPHSQGALIWINIVFIVSISMVFIPSKRAHLVHADIIAQ